MYTQTSGSPSETYRVIQYALVATDEHGKEVDTLSSFVQNDGPQIDRYAYAVHHIDERRLASENAPSQLHAFQQLVAFLQEQARHGTTVLVAHNGYAYDFKYLHHTLHRLGLALPDGATHFVDTLRLARAVDWGTRPVNFRLGTLYRLAAGRDLAGAHDALADTRGLATVFFRQQELCNARLSQVHAWTQFEQIESMRQRAKRAAIASGRGRVAMDDSDGELESDDEDEHMSDRQPDSDEENESMSDEGEGDDTAGEQDGWAPFSDGSGMDRDPETMFAASQTQAGVKFRSRLHGKNAWEVFLLLYKRVEDLLVRETNRYARQRRAAAAIKNFLVWCVHRRKHPFDDNPFSPTGTRRWKPVTRAEMRRFWGVALRCALNQSLSSTVGNAAYGDSSPVMQASAPVWASKQLGRHRFEQIKRYLHASDSSKQPARGTENYDAGYKLRGLFERAMTSWNEHFDPGAVISIDETLLSFKGRFSHRTTIRSKRHKTGLKLYVATGVRPNYVVAVDVKCSVHNRRQAGQFEGTKVVLDLMDKAKLLHQNRTVCTDNWYTSTELLKALRAKSTNCFGVLRATRVPRGARFTDEEKRQPRGFSKTLFNKGLDAMVVGWRDNKILYCLSNATSSRCDHQVRRRIKGVGATQIDAPDTLRRYNLDMGGVDWVRDAVFVVLCGVCACVVVL